MITFLQGDMFADPDATAYAHGCNCVGVMGAGVALEVRRRWPEAYAAYKAACPLVLGTALRTGPVWHLATQYDPGPYARMDAIDQAVRAMVKEPGVVAMPRIGCGIGGLKWSEVSVVIQRAAERSRVCLVRVYEWGHR